MNGKKQMTIAGIAAAVVLGGSVLTAVNDWSPFTWRWDSNRAHEQIARQQMIFAGDLKSNEIAILEVKIDQLFRDRLAVGEALRSCESQQTQPSQSCAQLRRDEAILLDQENTLRNAKTRKLIGD